MEGPGAVSEVHQQSSSNSRRFGMQLTSANLLPGPLSALLEFTGILRGRGSHHVEIDDQEVGTSSGVGSVGQYSPETQTRSSDGGAEVSIRIFGVGEPEQMRVPDSNSARNNTSDASILPSFTSTSFPVRSAGLESISSGPAISPQVLSTEERGEELPETVAAGNGNGRDAGSQRYDFQQLARWIEQALPFAILLFMVFIRQHLQGECWVISREVHCLWYLSLTLFVKGHSKLPRGLEMSRLLILNMTLLVYLSIWVTFWNNFWRCDV